VPGGGRIKIALKAWERGREEARARDEASVIRQEAEGLHCWKERRALIQMSVRR
jgi:hypothetical protein